MNIIPPFPQRKGWGLSFSNLCHVRYLIVGVPKGT